MLKKMLKANLLSDEIKKIKYKQAELNKLQNKISEWNEIAIKIQANFSFILPNYIIDEIIENQEKQDYINLHYLVNCAVINGRISENNGKMIKQLYS